VFKGRGGEQARNTVQYNRKTREPKDTGDRPSVTLVFFDDFYDISCRKKYGGSGEVSCPGYGDRQIKDNHRQNWGEGRARQAKEESIARDSG
jgi:hypothetical protein